MMCMCKYEWLHVRLRKRSIIVVKLANNTSGIGRAISMVPNYNDDRHHDHIIASDYTNTLPTDIII